ncbi:hypothetical protein [Mycobacterium sp. AZCC_0083]|uniref:hypothetical protein n=1 Tax=Mycobacterium sp. AZCC_0083 TaxID=2735882 RepID=UPI001614D4B8|nr:hypothetical protein [Mycobacterium sp. AZCC_0083]MBB5163746.1 hypothetical protein [Mycobacterium sp. AZCC_0083]
MDAPLKIRGRRNVVAALASGVVISLTAMTTGIAPAFADPKPDPVSPTTIVAVPEPAPVQQAPQEAPAPKPQQQAPVIAEPPAAPPVAPVIPQAPVSVEAPPPPKVPEAPVVTQAPVTQTQAPQTQAPAIVQAPPQTKAPVTQDPPVTQSAPAKPPTVAPTTAASAPATSADPPAPPTTRRSVAPSAAPTPAEPEPKKPDTPATSAAPATTSASAPPSEGSTPPSPALVGPPSAEVGATATATAEAGATPTSPAESSSTERPSGVEKTASSSVSQAAKVIETLAPERLKAPEQDVVLAKSAKPVEQLDPVVAPKQDVDAIAKAIDVPNFDRNIRDDRNDNNSRRDNEFFPGGDRKWDRNVRQWDPNWVEYDDYYRPVLSNPYRNPVKIIYIYQNAPRIVYIPPLARIILEVAQFAAYSFTAIVTNTINQAVNVAVGSFFGGGYYPGIGLPLPPPPPPLFRYDNVPVQVRYSDNRVYEPFRVQRIVDVGDDRQYGERKVLLDGVTPAWGEWNQTPTGERQFEVHRTQQFPGLDEPREGPLPGDYQLRLASDESPAGFKGRDAFLLTTAVLLGALSLAAVGWAVLLGRRRTQH